MVTIVEYQKSLGRGYYVGLKPDANRDLITTIKLRTNPNMP
jgi:hypothetical protein